MSIKYGVLEGVLKKCGKQEELKIIYTNVGIGRLCMLFGKTRHAFYDKSWFLEEREEVYFIALEMVAEIRR